MSVKEKCPNRWDYETEIAVAGFGGAGAAAAIEAHDAGASVLILDKASVAGGSTIISGGLASFPGDGQTCRQLLGAADQALRESKQSGKNAITLIGVT